MRTAEILGSFAYFAKSDMAALMRRARARGVNVDFLADSGAFTAYTTGKQVSLKQYATWLQLWGPHINSAMTLDVIGDPAASTHNTLALEDMVGDAVYVIPIFHVGSPWSDLERWCASHPYVALGGGVAVNLREKAFIAWLVRCHKVARDTGTVLHGLGMTRPPYPDLLPFYSVDSSFWRMSERNGAVTLFDPSKNKWICVRHPDVRKGPEYVTRARTRPDFARLIRSYGGDPEEIGTIGFGLVGERGKERASADRNWLSSSAAESWMRYGEHLRRHHGTITSKADLGTGPKVYLAAANVDQFDLVVGVAAHRTLEGSTP